MKINLKMIVAIVVMIGAVFWAVTSVRSAAYAGTDLDIAVGAGTVTVTNASDFPVSAQLTSSGARTFSVVSSIDGLAGTSARQGTGASTTQLFELSLPPGVSDFTVLRGAGVSFTAPGSPLDVTVEAVSPNDLRTTIIVAAVVVLGGLFYLSRSTDHRWLSSLRGKTPAQPTTKVTEVTASAGQGTEIRAYGDNRAP